MEQLSKHLRECLDIIRAAKTTPFRPIDFFPKIKRGDWVFNQLLEAGEITRFYVGDEAFFQLSTKKK